MNEDITEFLADTSGTSYIESLVKTRQHLPVNLLVKLDKVIEAELDLALLGAEKAKNEILKKSKDNIKPLKGV